MSHKDEAEKGLETAAAAIENGDLNAAQIMTLDAQVYATLALVEAQEARTEQARIANLIALASADLPGSITDPALDALGKITPPTDGKGWIWGKLNPNIAAALGVQEGQ